MIIVAIAYENGNPVRAFKDDNCIFKAYSWFHRHYNLSDEGYSIHQLPDDLKVKVFLMDEKQFTELTA